MRTALFLLLLLAVAAVPGSLFPQRPANPSVVTQYIKDHPDYGKLLDSLQLFDVYSSAWFSAIYILLFISLIGCVVPRAIAHYRAMRSQPPRTPQAALPPARVRLGPRHPAPRPTGPPDAARHRRPAPRRRHHDPDTTAPDTTAPDTTSPLATAVRCQGDAAAFPRWPLGMLRWAWTQLTSMRTALFLLLAARRRRGARLAVPAAPRQPLDRHPVHQGPPGLRQAPGLPAALRRLLLGVVLRHLPPAVHLADRLRGARAPSRTTRPCAPSRRAPPHRLSRLPEYGTLVVPADAGIPASDAIDDAAGCSRSAATALTSGTTTARGRLWGPSAAS